MTFPSFHLRGRTAGFRRLRRRGPTPTSIALACSLAICLVAASALPAPAAVTEQELQAARERRQRVQQQLDETVAAYDAAQTKLARTQTAMDRNREELQELEEFSEQVQERLGRRANEVYRQGPASLFQFLIGSENFSDFGRRVKLLQEASDQDAGIIQEAEIARTKLDRLQADMASQEAEEEQILESMAQQTASLNANFSEARELEAQLAADKATAERRAQQRREAAEQAAAEQAAEEQAAAEQRRRAAQEAEEEAQDEREEAGAAASPSPTAAAPSPSPSPSPPSASVETDQGPSASGLYCPVDGPVSFTDTFGAPRSGGRSHQGVDMFAAMGTPVAAITDGTITRRSSSTLGGLYIYFKGNNGTEYFYTHLKGFADAPVGGQIEGGTHIGYVGNSGNARGTPPHVHFEVAPAGSGTINPTPTARRACGK